MRILRAWMLLALGVVSAANAAQAAAPMIEVFTTQSMPASNLGDAKVHYVDAMVALTRRLSAGLPRDLQAAQALARERVAGLGPESTAQAAAGAQGLARAAQLGVTRVPAVVFDGRWVVYGVADVSAARRLFATAAAQYRR